MASSFSLISSDSLFRDSLNSEDKIWEEEQASNGRQLDRGIAVSSISASADPNASLKFDIRARSAEVKVAYARALAGITSLSGQIAQAEKQLKATPIYSFKQRAALYKAVSDAQSKFRIFGKFAQLEKGHLDYLDALSKSSLPPEEQHEKYAKFRQAVQKAKVDSCYADSFSTNVRLASTTLSSTFNKKFIPLASKAVRTATQSERAVQKLLKEIQDPHTESAHNLAQVLQYRRARLHQIADKSPPEAKQLRDESREIQSFVTAGGLDALSLEEANQFNQLFRDAAAKYKIFQKASADYKESTSPTPSLALDQAKQEFEQADALVMAEMRKLADRLKGPRELRTELTSHLKHKEALKAAAGTASVPKIDKEIATLKRLLTSPQLASIASGEASQLVVLIRRSNEAYAAWEQLEVKAKALEATATKAEAEAEASKKATEKTKQPAQQSAEKATAAKTAAQAAQEAAQKARAAATAARAKANAAKPESTTADKAITDNIASLLQSNGSVNIQDDIPGLKPEG